MAAQSDASTIADTTQSLHDAHLSPFARLRWGPPRADAAGRAGGVRISPGVCATAETVSLGEVFTFLSGLYFRGKLAYANAFARPDRSRVLVITPTRGLVPAVTPVTLSDLREFAEVDIEEGDPRYRKPLERDLRRLVRRLSPQCEVVLLGSVATGKYVSVLLEILPERLRFPAEFVGRGDMSRGGLLLRCAVDGTELAYIPVQGAVRKGKRPPKLEPRRYLTR